MELNNEEVIKTFLYLAKTMLENNTDNAELNVKNKGAIFKFDICLTEIKLPENIEEKADE